MIVDCGGICRKEFFAAERRTNSDFASTGHADVDTDVAVPVDILDQPAEAHLHVLPSSHAAASSHGLRSSRSGRLSKARSRAHLSQLVRELTSLGPGIRRSATILSNSDGETPMYMADSSRERPRCGTGRVSERARAMAYCSDVCLWAIAASALRADSAPDSTCSIRSARPSRRRRAST